MATPPRLFETEMLARRRDRALTLGYRGGGDFLQRHVLDGLAERVTDTARAFPRAFLAGSGAGDGLDAFGPRVGAEAFSLAEISPAMAGLSGADLLEPDLLAAEPGRSDLALSCLLMHWLNDPVGHLIQLRETVRPDGLILAALFGGQTLAELRACFAEAEAEVIGGLNPRIAPMGEVRELGSLLQRAALAMPVADSERITVEYETPLHLMRELRAMGETNLLSGRQRSFLRRDVLTRACEIYHTHFPAPGGRIRATFEIVYLTGWRPGPDQPQPLRPGSAKARLADALNTTEQDPEA